MAFYADEEEIWKCPIPKHSSKRRRTGICPNCLKDRLNALCPDCANLRPCICCTASSSSCSSSSSRSSAAGGAVGRVSNLIDSEPSFRRSRSVAIPFLRSRLARDRDAGAAESGTAINPSSSQTRSSSIWSVFKFHRSKRSDETGREVEDSDKYSPWMMRSRSVSVPIASNSGAGEFRSTRSKGWHFPSPMKVFRSTKTSTAAVHERSSPFVQRLIN